MKKKNGTSIKNWSHHYFVNHVYTKLTETNRMTNGTRDFKTLGTIFTRFKR